MKSAMFHQTMLFVRSGVSGVLLFASTVMSQTASEASLVPNPCRTG